MPISASPNVNGLSVAYVIPSLHQDGGTERAFFELAHAALRAGHRVTVFASQVKGLDPRIRWIWTPSLPGPGLVVFLSFWLSNHIVRALRRWVLREHFDVLHATGPDVWSPDVVSYHCDHYTMFEDHQRGAIDDPWFLARASHRALACVAGWFEGQVWRNPRVRLRMVVSEIVRIQLEGHHGAAGGAVALNRNGVDLSVFQPHDVSAQSRKRQVWNMTKAPWWIVFVGNAWKHKGLAVLLEACGRMEDPSVGVCVVGQGDVERYRRLAAQVGLAHCVFHAGGRSPQVLSDCYGAANVLVQPSRVDAFGLPVLEAMACGRAVIVSAAAGVSELIVPNKNGLLFKDPSSVEELCGHLRALRNDPALERRLGEAAAQTARAYSWDTVTQQVLTSYDGLR